MIERDSRKMVEDALRRQAAVALIGPRQVGKTTLALKVGETTPSIYLDLEDPDDRLKLSNPNLFFERYEDQLVILDEIHRMPEIFDTLRGVIDRSRRKNKGKGRFLILGSASIDLLKQSGESLAGRIAYVTMDPLHLSEVGTSREDQDRLWLRGGFPDAYLAEHDEDSFKLRRDFIRTYLERDIPMFGPRVPATTMERMWMMLSNLQGSLLNASNLARSLDISAQSVTRYIDLLCDLLLVRRLPPYHANIGKRLVRSPKTYVRDSGLVHAQLGLKTLEDVLGHQVVGASWEGFVIEELIAASPEASRHFFYRTAAGAELDYLLQHPDGRLWAFEIKSGAAAKVSRGFHQSIEDLNVERAFVVHAGDSAHPITEKIEAVGVAAALDLFRAA
ncbi:MAG: ATP-binding protein [Pseudomonadota bacterium]